MSHSQVRINIPTSPSSQSTSPKRKNMRTFELLFLTLNIFLVHGLDCPESGWSKASDICYRIVHFPESFWAAYNWCQTVKGQLLSLKNVEQVMAAIGDSMKGNAGDYRIDGYAQGTWYHKDNNTLENEGYEFLSELTGKTLTVNLQDGMVSENTEERTRVGFICEGTESLDIACDKEGLSQDNVGNMSIHINFALNMTGFPPMKTWVRAMTPNNTVEGFISGTTSPETIPTHYIDMDSYLTSNGVYDNWIYSKATGEKFGMYDATIPKEEELEIKGTFMPFEGSFFVILELRVHQFYTVPTITVGYPNDPSRPEVLVEYDGDGLPPAAGKNFFYACINGMTGDVKNLIIMPFMEALAACPF